MGMKIIVVKFMSLGDAVMSTVGFQMIRKAFPKAQITVLTLDSTSPIYENCDFIDRIITEPQKIFWSDRNYIEIARRVINWRKERYNLAVSFHIGKAPNAIISLLNADKKVIPGVKDLKHLASPDGKSFKPGLNHYTQVYPEIARSAIIAAGGDLNVDIPRPKIVLTKEEENECHNFLSKQGLEKKKFIALFPGGGYNPGNQVKVKRYPGMQDAIKVFQKKYPDVKIVLLGSETDKEVATKIINAGNDQIINMIGKTTIRKFINFIDKSGLLITTDSSALHIGQACKVPIVAIFGPTDPAEFVDPRSNVKVIKPSKARPVYTGKYFGDEEEAMKNYNEISIEIVVDTIEKAWKEVNEDTTY